MNNDDDKADYLTGLCVEESIIAALCYLEEHAKVIDKKLTTRERAPIEIAGVHLYCAIHKLTGLDMDEMKKLVCGWKDNLHDIGRTVQ